tara:strand:- start:3117 stop:3560 length:444 start_codon:yes stop_codon:yes gene_type:complete
VSAFINQHNGDIMAEQAKTDTKTQLNSLLELVKQAPADYKSAMRDALGTGSVIQKNKPPQNNADAKRIAFTVGEILHPEGFEPKPSEGLVAALGKEEAQRVTTERYLRNQGITGASSTITGRDADQMNIASGEMTMSPEEAADLAVE